MQSPGQTFGSVALRYRQPVVRHFWPPPRNDSRRYGWLADREPEAVVAEGPTARSERAARLEAVLLLAQEPLAGGAARRHGVARHLLQALLFF